DGGPIDAGQPAADAGTIDCTADAGCPSSGCSNIAATYKTCAVCTNVGNFGPYFTAVTQACGCRLRGCITNDGGMSGCGDGCISTSDFVTIKAVAAGVMLNCSGPYSDGGIVLTCPAPPIT